MANCCSLIETYVSFIEAEYRDTNGFGRPCFEYFFKSSGRFKEFSAENLAADFYKNVRCGILHNAEIRNGWTITRNQYAPYFNRETKKINAVKFATRLKNVLSAYRKNLIESDFDIDTVWINFRNRMNDLLERS
jgi:hypothetical protein